MNELRTQLERRPGWIVLALVLGGFLLVMLPFRSALIWGTVLTVSSWPLYRRLVNVLAVGYRLVAVWLSSRPSAATPEVPAR